MFEVGAVVRPWGHHDDRGFALGAGRGERAQAAQKLLAVVIDGGHVGLGKNLGEEPHHDRAVLQHVGDPRGRAQIVFKNVEYVLLDANDVDACNMDVHIAGQVHALHFRTKERIAQKMRLGNHTRANYFLRMIDVVKKEIESLHPLHESGG
jgi:hypothetical protein